MIEERCGCFLGRCKETADNLGMLVDLRLQGVISLQSKADVARYETFIKERIPNNSTQWK